MRDGDERKGLYIGRSLGVWKVLSVWISLFFGESGKFRGFLGVPKHTCRPRKFESPILHFIFIRIKITIVKIIIKYKNFSTEVSMCLYKYIKKMSLNTAG